MRKIGLITASLVAIFATTLIAQPSRATPLPTKEVSVEVHYKGEVRLEKASIEFAGDSRILKLLINNRSAKRVDKLQFNYKVYKPDGNVRSGGGWIERVDVPEHSPLVHWRLLQNQIEPNDRVVLELEDSTGK